MCEVKEEKNVITMGSEILIALRSTKDVKVMFIKKDGTDRIMNCTLDFGRIPKEHYPKKVEASVAAKPTDSKSFVKVFDLEKKAWRGFIAGSLKWLSIGNIKYKVKLEE